MSRNRARSGSQSTSRASREGETAAATTPKKTPQTVAERIFNKSKSAHALVESLLELATRTGVPEDLVGMFRNAAADLAQIRTSVVGQLVNSGWQPTKVAALKALQEGDRIMIGAKHREAYAFIPGLADGTVKLVAGTIVRTANGRIQRVLLKSPALPAAETDSVEQMPGSEAVYGYAPLAHLQRA